MRALLSQEAQMTCLKKVVAIHTLSTNMFFAIHTQSTNRVFAIHTLGMNRIFAIRTQGINMIFFAMLHCMIFTICTQSDIMIFN